MLAAGKVPRKEALTLSGGVRSIHKEVDFELGLTA